MVCFLSTNLLLYTNYFYLAVEGGYLVVAIYTDLNKPFDKVDNYLLLRKLAATGINHLLIVNIKGSESY